MMYKANADYDNVVITPNPQLTTYANDFNTDVLYDWSGWYGNGSYTYPTDGTRVLQQSNTEGDSRLLAGIETTDQIVEARAKATLFDGADRWFGLAARYADDNNTYYLSVRNSNQVSLRKIAGSIITVLDSAPLTVSANTWYSLRLEVIGNTLRGYVNGQLVVEANDSSIASGRYGMTMYKTAARFDDLKAYEP
jgi:hypothetical protein